MLTDVFRTHSCYLSDIRSKNSLGTALTRLLGYDFEWIYNIQFHAKQMVQLFGLNSHIKTSLKSIKFNRIGRLAFDETRAV